MLFWGAGFILVFLTAFLLTFIQYRIIKTGREEFKSHPPDNPVECGAAVDIRYECRGFPLVPGCTAGACLEFKWHDRTIEGSNLYTSGSRRGMIRIVAGRRGEYHSGGPFFIIRDAAGFFRFRACSLQEQYMTVEPHSADDIKIPRIMSTGGDDVSRTLKKKRNDNLIETRQYYPGDDVRRINWKAFAHLGELFIRLGEERPDPNAHLLIVPDFSGPAEDYLNQEQRGRYLDFLVEVLSGIIDRLTDTGVSIEVLSPPGVEYNPAGMWWNEEIALERLLPNRKCSCLLISSAFSENASKYCRRAFETGMPVSALVPVPPAPEKKAGPGLPARLIFTGSRSVPDDYSTVLHPAAEGLTAELSGLKGVFSADII